MPTSKTPAQVSGAVAVAAAAVLAYARTFGVPFLYDDAGSITGNASLRSWRTVLLPPPAETVGGRPVLNLSLALNHALGGNQVWAYHAANLAIHVVAGITLLGVLRLSGRLREPLCLAATLLWVLHPLQTESVTYVVQRAESLMGLFFLLCLYCFIRYASGGGRGWAWLSAAACLLGAGTKESAAAIPLVVLLYDRTFLAGSFRGALVRRRGLHAALLASWVPLLLLAAGTHGRGNTAGFGTALPWWRYAAAQPGAIVRYLRLAVWPDPLVFDYGTALDTALRHVLPAALFVGILAAGTLWALVRRPAAGFLGASFFLILGPTSSVIPIATEPIAEHRMYLPLAALAVGAAAAAGALLGRRAAPLLLAAALALGCATFVRNRAYADERTIWADTLAKRPGNERAHTNLGNALGRTPGGSAAAIAQYEEALRLNPSYAEAQFDLGCELERIPGRLDEAIGHYRAAVRLQPGFADARNNLGGALERIPGREAEAAAQFEEAVRLRPDNARARANLGAALLDFPGRTAEAIPQLEASLRLDPQSVPTRLNLAVALLRAGGRTDEATAHLREVLRLDPANVQARELLGSLAPR